MIQPVQLTALETTRAALVGALREGGLEADARALAALRPLGSAGWVPAWITEVGATRARLQQWIDRASAMPSTTIARRTDLLCLCKEMEALVARASSLEAALLRVAAYEIA